MQRVWIAIIIIIVFAVGFIAWRFFGDSNREFFASRDVGITFELDQSPEAQERKDEIDQVVLLPENSYVHESPNFTFVVPEGHNVGTFEEGGGQSVVVQNTATGLGFQIFVSAFDEDIQTLTPERIKQDVPNIIMERPQQVSVQGNTGLAFVSQNPAFGKSREVWFVHSGYLYQMSTYVENEALLLKVLGTFRISNF